MPKDLPSRSTRGKRLRQAVEDDEDDADTAFWNQEFFAEDAVDNDYNTESEPEDIIDSDFDQQEDADDDEEVAVKDDEPRKKTMKPPGYTKPKPKPKPKSKPKGVDDEYEGGGDEEEEEEEEEVDDEEGGAPRKKTPKAARPPPEPIVYVAPTLRRSTVTRVSEATRERQEKKKPTRRRAPGAGNWRPLTQGEMLAEAALNEIENTRSLKALLALEEETKRKAQVVAKKATGPSVKFKSRRAPPFDEEKTTLELVNTLQPPPWMAAKRAPPPPHRPACPITGLPAKYLERATRTPISSALAFQRLRAGAGPLPPATQQQLVWQHMQEEQQRAQVAPEAARGALLEQLRAQRQHGEQLDQYAQAAVAAAQCDPRLLQSHSQGYNMDVMAMVVDVHRTLVASH